MTRIKWLAVLVSFVFSFAVNASFAADAKDIHGLWKLVSYEIEIQTTGEKIYEMGKNPPGYVLFMPEGRVFFMFTGEGRTPGKTAEESAKLFKTLVAYTGTYRVEGDKFITKVEVAWNPAWVGTEQTRYVKIIGNRIQITTPWRLMPNWADKGTTRSIVTVERVTQQ
jgi:hypothetical protein